MSNDDYTDVHLRQEGTHVDCEEKFHGKILRTTTRGREACGKCALAESKALAVDLHSWRWHVLCIARGGWAEMASCSST